MGVIQIHGMRVRGWILGMRVRGFLYMYRGTSLIRKRPPPGSEVPLYGRAKRRVCGGAPIMIVDDLFLEFCSFGVSACSTTGLGYVRANLFGLTRILVNHPLDGSAESFYGTAGCPAVVRSNQSCFQKSRSKKNGVFPRRWNFRLVDYFLSGSQAFSPNLKTCFSTRS